MTKHVTPAQYLAQRAQVEADFTARAKARRAEFESDPSQFTLSDAIDIVGLDQAMDLYAAGKVRK